MKHKFNNRILINSVLVIIIIILLLLYIKAYKSDYFVNNTLTTNPLTTKSPEPPEPIDRTKLYGSLSLQPNFFQTTDDIIKNIDNPIDNTIINMSNPNIKYEEQRIQLSNYSDILL